MKTLMLLLLLALLASCACKPTVFLEQHTPLEEEYVVLVGAKCGTN